MGVVYRATQVSIGRQVALKLISSQIAESQDFRARFEHEWRLAASIDHPHVVSIYTAGEHDGQPFIAMQWINGVSLQVALQGLDGLPEDRATTVVCQIAGALDAVHAAGLVHRDIKPGNIMLRSISGQDHAYLTDFGLAKRTAVGTPGLTRTGQMVGTFGYMAPEQLRGESGDARSDLYALGCVLVECLTGQQPFVRDNEMAVSWAHMNDPRPVPSQLKPGLSPAFDAVIARAMAIEPAERYGSGAEMAAALMAAHAGRPLPAPAPPTEIGARPHVPGAAPTPLPLPGDAHTAPIAPGGGANRTPLWIALAVIATLAVAVGAYAAAGGLAQREASPQPGPEPIATRDMHTPTQQVFPAEPAPTADRQEVQQVLQEYASYYSAKNVSGLSRLFTSNVARHGLSAEGCSETEGIDRVLDTYTAQFNTGSGTYALKGLGPKSITVAGDTASATASYVISSGGSGEVSFDLVRQGPSWLISRVDASC
ncbi:MAG: hypothetical protein QOG62_2503 [Thermoleophilaceae bacterium]|nr:hypothetical protein [Thermoleophilaceae bacterium]